MSPIPCMYCGADVEPRRPGSYREIHGFERVRAKGGAGSIFLRVETGRVACPSCMDRLRHGIDPAQGALTL